MFKRELLKASVYKAAPLFGKRGRERFGPESYLEKTEEKKKKRKPNPHGTPKDKKPKTEVQY